MRPAYLVFAVILLAAPTVAAGEMRLLTLDNETSTSDCIGDPKTPLCAVETMSACGLRIILTLCDVVESKPDFLNRNTPITKDSYIGISAYWYETIGQRELTNADVAQFAERYGDGPWQTGDVAVTHRWTVCRPEDACITESRNDPSRAYGEGCPANICRRESGPRTTIVRRKGERWIIVRDYLEYID
jgi:hypothetical protein